MKRTLSKLLCMVLGCVLLLGVFAGATVAAAEEAASGKCGQDITWQFDAATGTLTIGGKGVMWDYDRADSVP